MSDDLFEKLQERNDFLDRTLKALRKHGIAYANSEHAYREAMTIAILKHRADGVPVTIIRDICLGTPEISDLRLRRDIEESEYKAAQEALQVYKLQLRLLEAQIDREYRG